MKVNNYMLSTHTSGYTWSINLVVNVPDTDRQKKSFMEFSFPTHGKALEEYNFALANRETVKPYQEEGEPTIIYLYEEKD